METVRRGQMDSPRPRPAIETRRNPEGPAKCAGECFTRSVAAVERNVGNGLPRAGQLPRGPFEQNPPPHLAGILLDKSLKQPVEVGAALKCAPRQFAGSRGIVQRANNYGFEAFRVRFHLSAQERI